MSNHLYVWTVDDGKITPAIGDIASYAHDWEYAHYEGFHVSNFVWSFDTGEPVTCRVQINYQGTSADDFMNYDLSIGDETVCVRIDGRA